MTGLEKYYVPNLDMIKQKAEAIKQREQSRENGGDLNWYNFDNGTTIVRILPPWDERGLFAQETYKHRFSKEVNHVCVQKQFPNSGALCPVCDVMKRLEEMGFKEQADSLYPRFGAYVNTIIRGAANPDQQNPWKVWITRLPRSVYDKLYQWMANPDVGMILDPINGCDLMIERTGKEWHEIKYSVSLTPNGRSAISSDMAVINAVLSNLPKLDQIFKAPNQEIMTQIAKDAQEFYYRYAPTGRAMGSPTAAPLPPTIPGAVPPVMAPPPPPPPMAPVSAPVPPAPAPTMPPPPPAPGASTAPAVAGPSAEQTMAGRMMGVPPETVTALEIQRIMSGESAQAVAASRVAAPVAPVAPTPTPAAPTAAGRGVVNNPKFPIQSEVAAKMQLPVIPEYTDDMPPCNGWHHKVSPVDPTVCTKCYWETICIGMSQVTAQNNNYGLV